jgi:hypothetical protein
MSVEPSGRQEMFLDQYISQIVAAVRPCLTTKWASHLVWHATNVIFQLFVGGYLKDKVLVKRLGKLIFAAYEVPDLHGPKPLRPLPSADVAEEVVRS